MYYDAAGGSFYAINDHGEYQRYGDRLLGIMLRSAGFRDDARHANGLTYLESELLRIASENSVHFAGPLGGYPVGEHSMYASRVLATKAAEYITPAKGEFPHFRQFLKELLGPESKYFCGWMKAALESLTAGPPWSPGQLLAIAGPPHAGKSFLQSLITPMLGGRVSSPYKYMAGGTGFNSEIYGAEHGLIGDQNHKYDKNSRRAFGAAIKDLVVNPEQYVRGLFKGAMTLHTFLRLTLTLNDNAQALLVLPEMDSDVADKIMLLHARQVNMPFPSKRFPTKHDYKTALESELPAFLWHLRRWNPPADLFDQRYGVVSYKSPGLIQAMNSLSSEWKLWNLVEMYVFSDRDRKLWTGTAAELEKELRDKVKSENLGWLFFYPGACGQYLASLQKHLPDFIDREKKGKNLNHYTITRPKQTASA